MLNFSIVSYSLLL